MSKIVFPETDFRQIGQAFIRRKANDDIDGEQVVEIDGSDSQDREGGSQRRESLRDLSPFGDTDDASDDADDDTEDSGTSIERVKAWKEQNEEYL
jgi:hypothetical protein